jgi:membrane protein YdbS with pleckstrin-like domain
MKKKESSVTRMSPWVLLHRLILVEVVFFCLFFGFDYLVGWLFQVDLSQTWWSQNLIWLILLHLIEILSVIYISVVWSMTVYSFSEYHIMTRQGVFSMQQNVYNTINIESVKVRQSFWQLFFGMGNIYLSAPTLKETVIIKNVHRPERIAQEIEGYMEQSQRTKIVPISS